MKNLKLVDPEVIVDYLVNPQTGIYFNRTRHEYQAWIVNDATGDKRCIGGIAEEVVRENPDAFRLWKERVWQSWLTIKEEENNANH